MQSGTAICSHRVGAMNLSRLRGSTRVGSLDISADYRALHHGFPVRYLMQSCLHGGLIRFA